MKDLTYKCHSLAINELPNFNSPQDNLYRGTTIIDGKKWEKDGSAVYLIESWFQSKIDKLYRGMTFEQVCKEWGGNWKKLIYKDRPIYLDIRKRVKDNKVVYLGGFYTKEGNYNGVYKTIESIHYNKVVSKFEKFVDEYCSDWTSYASTSYKGYQLRVCKASKEDKFFGVCEIHKNSMFKCISSSTDEIEEKFRARIDQVLKYKGGIKMISPKEDRLKQLEARIIKLQEELEKVKNEKEVYVYKGVTLEYGKEEGLQEGYMIGRIKNAPEDTIKFYRKVAANMQADFEEYIDELEKSANLYLELTGQEVYIPEKHDC